MSTLGLFKTSRKRVRQCRYSFVRFAHFFASPLLLKQSLDREIEAVDNGQPYLPHIIVLFK